MRYGILPRGNDMDGVAARRRSPVLGEYVRTLRKARGWTQEYLAERANVDQTFISQVETNKTRPSFPYLQRLADGLAVPVADLLLAAGLVDRAPTPAPDELAPLLAYLTHDPELRGQLAAIRASETPEVYEQVLRGLVEAWKAELRLLLTLHPGATTPPPER